MQSNPLLTLIFGIFLLIGSFLVTIDLYQVNRTGVEIKGAVVEYAPHKDHGKTVHSYIISTRYGPMTKTLAHEKVKVGSIVVFIIPNGQSMFEDYDLKKSDNFLKFVLQKGWWICILGAFVIGNIAILVGLSDLKNKKKL